jgi:long-chain acyl-CoA synthetase
MREDTLPKLLERNYRKYGNKKVALRRKDFGFWKEYSWADYNETVKYLCLGLLEKGLQPNDKVAIMGDNDPEWYWSELAALAAGAQVVGLYPDAIPSEIKYILEHSESSIIIAHDQEQVDKLLGLIQESEQLTNNVKLVVYWDPKGLGSYNLPILANFYYLVEQGKKYDQDHPDQFYKMVENGKGDDIAILCYTSGTKSLPKGAVISHKNLIFGAERFSIVVRMLDSYNILSYVSPAWIAEQSAGICMQLVSGVTINFGEKPETQAHDIREIGPDMIFYGPKLWESLVSTIQVKIGDAGFLKRFFYNLFLPVGYKKADIYFAGKEMGLFWSILYKISFWLVFRPLTDKLGLLQAKACMTGGAPLSPDTFRFLNGIGINLGKYLRSYGRDASNLACLRRYQVREHRATS